MKVDVSAAPPAASAKADEIKKEAATLSRPLQGLGLSGVAVVDEESSTQADRLRGRAGGEEVLIVLFTDFGRTGPYVGQMTAVLARMAPGTRRH